MTDRRALIVGSWLAKGRDKPTPQRVRALLDRWTRVLDDERYDYRGLADRQSRPVPLSNPRRVDLLESIANSSGVRSDTELLFYFVGHSVSSGTDDLELIIGTDDRGDIRVKLTRIIEDLTNAGYTRVIVVLDTCHAGRTQALFPFETAHWFTMLGTGDSYAFDANFSEAVLRAFEQPLRKNDQRVDRRAGGVTFRKIFEEATRRVLAINEQSRISQTPVAYGNYGEQILVAMAPQVPESYSEYVSSRTIYGRVHRLLHLIGSQDHTRTTLLEAVKSDVAFLVRHDPQGRPKSISAERLDEYLEFIRKSRWTIEPKGRLSLTSSGEQARDVRYFNRELISAIQKHILSEGIGLEELDAAVKDLSADMIPPTPVRIKDRLGMKGYVFKLDRATRVALQLLPASGMFMKGAADAIFPAELG